METAFRQERSRLARRVKLTLVRMFRPGGTDHDAAASHWGEGGRHREISATYLHNNVVVATATRVARRLWGAGGIRPTADDTAFVAVVLQALGQGIWCTHHQHQCKRYYAHTHKPLSMIPCPSTLGLTLRDTQAVDDASEEDARVEVLALESRVDVMRQRIYEADDEERLQKARRPAIASQPLSAEELARRRSGPRFPPGPVRNVRSPCVDCGRCTYAHPARVAALAHSLLFPLSTERKRPTSTLNSGTPRASRIRPWAVHLLRQVCPFLVPTSLSLSSSLSLSPSAQFAPHRRFIFRL